MDLGLLEPIRVRALTTIRQIQNGILLVWNFSILFGEIDTHVVNIWQGLVSLTNDFRLEKDTDWDMDTSIPEKSTDEN